VTPERIRHGTPEFRHTNLALFAAGMATFALIYSVQPLMPLFSRTFHVAPATSALSLSVTTLPLAFAMLAASVVADRFGRRAVMVVSLLASAALGLLCAAAPGFAALLALRCLMGFTLAGLPAVAIAYVAEEMAPNAVGLAMGLYIGGSAIGGMTGRLLSALLAQELGWRTALFGIGALGLVCGLLLWRYLPPSRHAHPARRSLAEAAAISRALLRDPVLLLLFAEGFVLMGAFVTVYNYTGYRLLGPPFSLTQGEVGLIFCVYLVGVASSIAMGHLALRAGRRLVIGGNLALMLAGALLTLSASLAMVIAGIAVLTAGFFGAHSVASAWVGLRATTGRAQASALYLFFYYAGSSVVGAAAGLLWRAGAWPEIIAVVAILLAGAIAAAAQLPRSAQEKPGARPLGPVTR
jgi:YNFM family putative membrane transporter